jgi:aryl-alcohol dehydrogenase-like predicted oxidoreductase
MGSTRTLGRSGVQVSALGLGTARIGGLGWSRKGDLGTSTDSAAIAESVRAIHRALDLGVTLFDTADCYGCGQSERILGQAIQGRRQQVVVATKFGETFDEETCESQDVPITPEYVARACAASLRRLNTDYIDLYIFHLRDFDMGQAVGIRDALEDLVTAGKIRYYGWSTDNVERARLFAEGRHCAAIEHRLNIFENNPEMLRLCKEENLASLNRIPLLCGVLTGRWNRETQLAEQDRRSDFFRDEGFLKLLDCVEKLRDVLEQDGGSYVQGALRWIWTRSEKTIPIPGFRTVDQVEEIAGAMRLGR